MATPSGRILTLVALCGVAACIALMAVRIDSAASLSVPMQVITSGWEQQPLFAIWRTMQGGPVYVDATRIPFSIAFYNWLFYSAYAAFGQAVMGALGLEDAWLPTVLRCFTLVALVCGTAVAFRVFIRIAGLHEPAEKLLGLAYAVLLFFGPLVGFWGFTVRPDLWAMVFELLAVLVFWSLRAGRPVAAVVLAAVCLYAAWSLKQSNVMTTVVITLYLLACRPRWHAVLFAGLLVGGYTATFAIGGENYVRSLLYTSEVSWSLDNAVRIVVNVAEKTTPILFVLGALAILAARDRSVRIALWRDPAARFVLLGVAVAMLLVLPATTKEGAAENYYFVPSFYLTLAALNGMRIVREVRSSALLSWSAVAGWGAVTVAVALVLAGLLGVRSVDIHHDRMENKLACLVELPKPLLTNEQYLSLPWMNPSRPSFVLNYNYPGMRAAGVDLEAGGVGGLIVRGYFAALALSHGEAAHDGAALNGYMKRPAQCAGLTIWIRKG